MGHLPHRLPMTLRSHLTPQTLKNGHGKPKISNKEKYNMPAMPTKLRKASSCGKSPLRTRYSPQLPLRSPPHSLTTAGAPRIVRGKVQKEKPSDKHQWGLDDLEGGPKMPGPGKISQQVAPRVPDPPKDTKAVGSLSVQKDTIIVSQGVYPPLDAARRPYRRRKNGPRVHSTRQVAMLRKKADRARYLKALATKGGA